MAKSDLLSYGTSASANAGGGRHIVCVSGGLASAWVAKWVRDNIAGEIIYYFNNTKWEHPDLYRFLDDLADYLGIKITEDNDGRTPEQVFYDSKILGSQRTPKCSEILKAKMLQKFVKAGDTLYFGIGIGNNIEVKRAARIAPIYSRLGCKTVFPIIDNRVLDSKVASDIDSWGLVIPQLYRDGFQHNNCAGGCVRANKRQWLSLLRLYPEVYAERERVEREFTAWNNDRRKDDPEYTPGDFHFLKDISLKDLREGTELGMEFDFGDDDDWAGECIGICGRMY